MNKITLAAILSTFIITGCSDNKIDGWIIQKSSKICIEHDGPDYIRLNGIVNIQEIICRDGTRVRFNLIEK